MFYGNFYYAKFWDNGALVRDFVPCVRKSDNKPGLYDRANGVFYANNGSGEFGVGYSYRYETNGGTGVSGEINYQNSLPAEFPVPNKEGYAFGGWYLDENLTIEAVGGQSLVQNVMLYAKWDPLYTISMPSSMTTDTNQSIAYKVLDGYKLNVSVSSVNGNKVKSGSNDISYTPNATSWSDLSGAGNFTYKATTSGIPAVAGEYTDTLTFTMSVGS